MWQFDTLLDCTEEAQMDELFQRVKQIAGEKAAVQINTAWNEAPREHRARKKKRAQKLKTATLPAPEAWRFLSRIR